MKLLTKVCIKHLYITSYIYFSNKYDKHLHSFNLNAKLLHSFNLINWKSEEIPIQFSTY